MRVEPTLKHQVSFPGNTWTTMWVGTKVPQLSITSLTAFHCRVLNEQRTKPEQCLPPTPFCLTDSQGRGQISDLNSLWWIFLPLLCLVIFRGSVLFCVLGTQATQFRSYLGIMWKISSFYGFQIYCSIVLFNNPLLGLWEAMSSCSLFTFLAPLVTPFTFYLIIPATLPFQAKEP